MFAILDQGQIEIKLQSLKCQTKTWGKYEKMAAVNKKLKSQYKITESIFKRKLIDKIDNAVRSVKTRRISDGNGLMLVIRPNASATWVWRYKSASKLTDFTLGHMPTMDLDAAREEVHRFQSLLASGINPALQRRIEKLNIASLMDSTHQVRHLYQDWFIARKSILSSHYQTNIEKAFAKHVLPVIGAKLLDEVTPAEIDAILDSISHGGAVEMRKRVAMWLRQMFEFGEIGKLAPVLNSSSSED